MTLLSLIALPPGQPVGFDKLNHLLAYAAICGWFGSCVHRRWLFAVILFAVCWGVLMEFLQSRTGYRTFEYYDMLANTLGALIGAVLVLSPLGRLVAWLDSRLSAHS